MSDVREAARVEVERRITDGGLPLAGPLASLLGVNNAIGSFVEGAAWQAERQGDGVETFDLPGRES